MTTSSFQARITKTVINRLKAGDTVWDSELKGFGARRQTHSVSYFLKTRVRGRQKWITIGKHGLPWTPDKARLMAMAIKSDPATSENQTGEIGMAGLVEEFKSKHLPKLKATTRRDYNHILDNVICSRLGDLKAIDITRTDAAELHNAMSSKPRQANVSLAVLSKLMSFAEEYGHRLQGTNPCVGIKKYPEKRRERYLSEKEMAQLGRAIKEAEGKGKISPEAAAAIRLLILTGARLGEILNLKHEYIDFQRKRIFLPDSKTGQKSITLNDPAIAILKSLPRLANNPYVITGQKEGQPLVNLQKPWRLVREIAKLEDVRLHDLRHSYASIAANSGGSLPMIGKLLGHTQSQTTARYAHLADDPVEKLNQEVGATIANAMKNNA